MTIPNILTLLRIILVPFFIAASVSGRFTAAFVLFVSAALTDVLDGLIARRFNQRSRIGALLDPAADKTMMIAGFVFYTFGSGPSLRVPGWLTYVVFGRDVFLILGSWVLYTRVKVKRFPPSLAGKVTTVLQAVTLGTAIAVNAFAPSLLWLAELLFRTTLVITLYSWWDYWRRGERLLNDGLAAARLDVAGSAS